MYFLLDEARVPDPDVVVSAARDLLTKLLEPLSRGSQLPDLLYFEAFSLLLHIFEENAQIGWDAVVTLQVFDVVALVELLAQLLAHGLDGDDRVRELDVRLAGILESDGTQDLELLILAFSVRLFLLLFHFNAFLDLTVRDAIEFLELLLKASQVQCIVSNGPNGLHKGYSHANSDRAFSGLALSYRLVGGLTIVESLLTEVFKLIDKLVDAFLGLLALGHFGTKTLLRESTWLAERLAETFFS